METVYSKILKQAFKLLEKEHIQKKKEFLSKKENEKKKGQFLKDWVEEKRKIDECKKYSIEHTNKSLIKDCSRALIDCE